MWFSSTLLRFNLVCLPAQVCALLKSSEDSLQKLILYFHHVCHGAQTQIVRLDGKRLYLLQHLPGPPYLFLKSLYVVTFIHVKIFC